MIKHLSAMGTDAPGSMDPQRWARECDLKWAFPLKEAGDWLVVSKEEGVSEDEAGENRL